MDGETLPLVIPSNFIEEISDWATSPYVSIEIQDSPCNKYTTKVAGDAGQVENQNQYICAVRGGTPFFNVTKPVDGKCPENTKACSTKTTGMNTVCYPEEDHEAKCPIIDI